MLGEINSGEILTVPDQVLPLPELIAKFASGAHVEVFKAQYLGDDSNVPDRLERMSFDERLELARTLKEHVQRNNKQDVKPSETPIARDEPPAPAKE